MNGAPTNRSLCVANMSDAQKEIIAQSIAQSIARARKVLRQLRDMAHLPPVGPREWIDPGQRDRK